MKFSLSPSPCLRVSVVIRKLAFAVIALTFAIPAAVAQTKPPETIIPFNRDVARNKAIKKRVTEGKDKIDVVFFGDSVTVGWEIQGKDVWKKYYEHRKPLNLGIGGDRTQHILWRIDNGNLEGISPKLVVLLIGTSNLGQNSVEDIAVGIKTCVARLRARVPEAKILVLGLLPRGDKNEKPDDPFRVKTRAINALIKDVGDGNMIHYVDFGDKLLNADGTQNRDNQPDRHHLSAKGYQIWADAIEPKVAELLGEKK